MQSRSRISSNRRDRGLVAHRGESGRNGRRQRSAFSELFGDAEKGRFDPVLFWSLDRFSREGIRNTIHYHQHLDAAS